MQRRNFFLKLPVLGDSSFYKLLRQIQFEEEEKNDRGTDGRKFFTVFSKHSRTYQIKR